MSMRDIHSHAHLSTHTCIACPHVCSQMHTIPHPSNTHVHRWAQLTSTCISMFTHMLENTPPHTWQCIHVHTNTDKTHVHKSTIWQCTHMYPSMRMQSEPAPCAYCLSYSQGEGLRAPSSPHPSSPSSELTPPFLASLHWRPVFWAPPKSSTHKSPGWSPHTAQLQGPLLISALSPHSSLWPGKALQQRGKRVGGARASAAGRNIQRTLSFGCWEQGGLGHAWGDQQPLTPTALPTC